VSLFSDIESVYTMPLTYVPPELGDGTPLILNLRGGERLEGQAVSVASLAQFRLNFNRSHGNVLHRLESILLEEPVIIAGGSVLRALTAGDDRRRFWVGMSDVDLFLHTCDTSEATRIAKRIFFALAVGNEHWVIVRSRGVITMHNWVGEDLNLQMDLKIQIVLRLYDSPAEILMGFDCDSCCCAYDGREVWVTPRCAHALQTGINVLNPIHAWPNRPSYELRLAKYAHRGFPVAVPGLDKKRIDHDLIRGHCLADLKGLARLLKISFAMEKGVSVVRPLPLDHSDLRYYAENEMDAAKFLITGLGFYDDDIDNVIIPRVYCSGGDPSRLCWMCPTLSDFPPANEIKAEAWSFIENAAGTDASVEDVPDSLETAWDTSKRSREYINAQGLDKFELDNQYYDHAYEKDG
jgi:hypothetical protein